MSFSGIFIHRPVATTLLALAISPRSPALRWNAGLGRAAASPQRGVFWFPRSAWEPERIRLNAKTVN